MEQWGEVHAAQLAVQQDDWQDKYRHVDDLTCRDAAAIGEKTILVWRILPDAPESYRVVFLGDPDDFAF